MSSSPTSPTSHVMSPGLIAARVDRSRVILAESDDNMDSDEDPMQAALMQAYGHKPLRECRAAKAKQDPQEKATRSALRPDGKRYFSYADIHTAIASAAERVKVFNPDVMVAIGGGGFIPARMLRTIIKVPILAVSLELYDDSTNTATTQVKKIQWFDEGSEVGSQVRGKRVLVVDEVDDSRTTLQFCLEELIKTNAPGAMAVCVVHNKLKQKKGVIPEGVEYIAADDVPDSWNCYPWDAEAYGNTIVEHEAFAATQREEGNGSGELLQTKARCSALEEEVEELRKQLAANQMGA